jgi:hypothetical protein
MKELAAKGHKATWTRKPGSELVNRLRLPL